MMKKILPFLHLLFIFLLAACGGATGQPAEDVTENTAVSEPAQGEDGAEPQVDEAALAELKAEAINTYAEIVYASYEDSYDTAVTLQAAINEFVANPSAETHQAAKDAWLAAREPYGQTEAFRFYGGPIDDEDGPEGLINAWPLDEAYIDYVEGNETAGIINNLEDYPEINAELLESLNEAGAEENISVGYHAIEFLLWGQDLSANGNGERPYTDYVVDGGTAANQERRAQYLTTAADLLVQHLSEMKEAWAPHADNYRAQFVAQDPDTALQAILTGIGVLSKSELAGERMFTAYDNQDQEDEHSCFSDNTHRDIINNAQGIANVILGAYTRPDGSTVRGTSLIDVVKAADPTLATEISALASNSMAGVNAIPTPFDQAIIAAEQRPLVLEAVYGLQDQGDKLAEVASALGIVVNTGLPE